MPFTKEFLRIRRRIRNQYEDQAKADTFAFQDAFKMRLRIFEDRKPRYKLNKKGQKAVAGILYLFMAVVCVALFISPVRDAITTGVNNISESGNENANFIVTIIQFWPVWLFIMILIIGVIIIR